MSKKMSGFENGKILGKKRDLEVKNINNINTVLGK